MDREQYEKDLKERQDKHLEQVSRYRDRNWQPCLHDQCPELFFIKRAVKPIHRF